MALLDVLIRSDSDPNWQQQTLAVGQVVLLINPTQPGQVIPFPALSQQYVPSSASITWGFAIVVAVGSNNACTLVSEFGDMRWTTISAANLVVVGKASAAAMEVANTRLNG